MLATCYKQANKQTKVFWWKWTSCPSHTSCAEVMKANICHLIKGYDLLTLELVLVASKAEFLKAVVTSREPNWSKVSCVIYVRLLWGFFFFHFMFSRELCAGGWEELQIILQDLLVSYSFRRPHAECPGMVARRGGERDVLQISPLVETGRKRAKNLTCVWIDNRAGSHNATCLLLLCVH